MPRIKNENYVTLDRASKVIYDLTGVVRKTNTVYKWAANGRIDVHGSIVKLRTVNKLGRLYTTVEWLKKFIEELG